MPTFNIIEEFSDPYFEIALKATPPKPPPYYGPDTSGRKIKVQIELTREGKTRKAATVAELLVSIKKLGVDPQEYAAKEPIMLAMMASYLQREIMFLHRRKMYREFMNEHNLSLEDYLPRWEIPFLIWYVLDHSEGNIPPIRECKIAVEQMHGH